MYKALIQIGYNVETKLTGEVKYETMRSSIIHFFTNKETNPIDILLFYFSGHSLVEDIGVHHLATSETDPFLPFNKGYSFEELIKMAKRSISRKIIIILDSCYSGHAAVVKGGAEENVLKGKMAIEETITNTIRSDETICILASCMSYQESVILNGMQNSLYTYYILDGLKGGGGKSVDQHGYVTPLSLGNYVYDELMNLPEDKRFGQKPIKRVDVANSIILAEYPEYADKSKTYTSVDNINVSIILERGYKFLLKGDFCKAREMFGSLTDKSFQTTAWHNKGLANFGLEDYEDAVKSFDKAIEVDSSMALVWYNRGLALAKLHRYDESVNSFDKALEIDKTDYSTWYNRGLGLSASKKYYEAIDSFDEAILLESNCVDAWNNKGVCLEHVSRSEEALECFERVLIIDNEDNVGWHNIGFTNYRIGNYDEAIQCFDKAIRLNPASTITLNYTALSLRWIGRYDEAMQCLDKAIDLDKDNVEAWNLKGSFLIELARFEESIQCLDKAIEIKSDQYNAYYNKGVAQMFLKHYEESIQCLDKAIQINPESF